MPDDPCRRSCVRYGHPLHIEQYGRIPKSQWDPPTSQCTAADVPNLCVARGLRDAATWMKFSAMLSHLENGTADYVLFVDADAVVVHPHHDTARLMVDTMEAAGKVRSPTLSEARILAALHLFGVAIGRVDWLCLHAQRCR